MLKSLEAAQIIFNCIFFHSNYIINFHPLTFLASFDLISCQNVFDKTNKQISKNLQCQRKLPDDSWGIKTNKK